METNFVAYDNNEVLTVKLGHETSFVAYSTDKRRTIPLRQPLGAWGWGIFLRDLVPGGKGWGNSKNLLSQR